MASAILLDPVIVSREVVVICGSAVSGTAVSRPIPESSSTSVTTSQPPMSCTTRASTVWQVPSNVYSQVSVSYAELEEKIGGTSKLADYLISQLVEWNTTYWPQPIESRSLGDSPAISLMLYPRGGNFRIVPAPRFGQEGHYLPGSGHPSVSSSRSTCGSCSKTCSPRSASSAATRPDPAQPFTKEIDNDRFVHPSWVPRPFSDGSGGLASQPALVGAPLRLQPERGSSGPRLEQSARLHLRGRRDH